MRKYTIIAVAAALVATTVYAARPSQATPTPTKQAACLAVAPGVCFSGTVEWVAAQAARMSQPVMAMGSIEGNAI